MSQAALVSLICIVAIILPVQAAELVVVDQADCPYCERFDSEIARAWPNTEEGRDVPLRRVGLHGKWPADLSRVAPATLTPTFILMEAGEERGRLVGYAGDQHFWFLIGELLDRLNDGAESATDRTDAHSTDSTEQ